MKTLLIIEDDFAQMEMLAFLFEGDGFRALRASNGSEALTLVGNEMPDLIITDVHMPVMGGAQFVAKLRAMPNGAAVPIILVSANRLVDGLAKEAVAIVQKPYLYETVLALVEETLAKK